VQKSHKVIYMVMMIFGVINKYVVFL
jgi:hypothetical protein